LRISTRAAQRAHGMRTWLVNSSLPAFLLGVPRLALLCVLRAVGFLIVRDGAAARAELTAVRWLLGGSAGLRAARSSRDQGSVRGLVVSRFTRLRAAVRRGVLTLVRNRVAGEAVVGKLPPQAVGKHAWDPGSAARGEHAAIGPHGPDALPPGAVRSASGRAGTRLRKPAEVLAVAVPHTEYAEGASPETMAPAHPVVTEQAQETEHVQEPEHAQDAGRSQETAPTQDVEQFPPGVVFVEVNRRRIAGATVLAPPVLLAVLLGAVAIGIHWGRLGLDLAGGQLLPVGELGQLWSTYLSSWQPVAGGVAGSVPPALAVLGILGAPLAPVGGPAALVSLLLLGDIPLAALSAYAASARLPVHRWLRAGIAAAYGLLPVVTAGVAQGMFGVVVG